MPSRNKGNYNDVLRDSNLSSTVCTLYADVVTATNTSKDAARKNTNVIFTSYADVLKTATKNTVDTKRSSSEKENIKQTTPSKKKGEKSNSTENCKLSNVKNQTPKKQEKVTSVIPVPVEPSEAKPAEFNGSGNEIFFTYDSDSDKDNSVFAHRLVKNIYNIKFDTIEGLAGKAYYAKLDQLNAIKSEPNSEYVVPVESIGLKASNDYHSDSEEEYISRPIIGSKPSFTFKKPISKNASVSPPPTQMNGSFEIQSCNKPNLINGHTSTTEIVIPNKTEDCPKVQNTSYSGILKSSKKTTGQNDFVMKNLDEEKLLDENATSKKQRKRAKRKLREQENQAPNKQEIVVSEEPIQEELSKINVDENDNIEKQKNTVEEDLSKDSLEDETTELRPLETTEKAITEESITEDLPIKIPDEDNMKKKVSLKIIKKRINYRKNCKLRKKESQTSKEQKIVDSEEPTEEELSKINVDKEENIEKQENTVEEDLPKDSVEDEKNQTELRPSEEVEQTTKKTLLMEKPITEESITEELPIKIPYEDNMKNKVSLKKIKKRINYRKNCKLRKKESQSSNEQKIGNSQEPTAADLSVVNLDEEENVENELPSEKQTYYSRRTKEDYSIEKTISEETVFEDISMQNLYEKDNFVWEIAYKNYCRNLRHSIIADVMSCCEIL